MTLDPDFLALSARLGRDPLRVQGPGGNTSIKSGTTMWIKASGTELADALDKPIFVAVDRNAALAELDGAGDGSCKAALIDRGSTLRPSIETTFHAVFDWAVVAHSHSVATIAHATSPEGLAEARRKLSDLSPVFLPYCKPGVPLTRAIRTAITPETRVVILENHGLICCGGSPGDVDELIDDIESRLALSPREAAGETREHAAPPAKGWSWHRPSAALAFDDDLSARAVADSYYPDHVVFLGPALPVIEAGEIAAHIAATPRFPAAIVRGQGVMLRDDATPAQGAMLTCLFDVLTRVPTDWTLRGIGLDAAAELLDWDAEKYRQALSKGGGDAA